VGIVGRGPVLAALRAAVDEVARGRGRLVLLAGEPGIGKTALADQALAYAGEHAVTTAAGAGWDGDGVPAFWPWRRVLASLRGPAAGTDWLDDADAAHDGQAGDDRDAKGGGAADARFRVFAGVTAELEALAAQRPLMVLLDDLHWADPGSLRLLAFVARQLRSVPLLLLGTYRDVDPVPNDDLRAFLADVADAERFTVVGLNAAEVGELLARTSGPVGTEVADTVHRRTGGNPFFVLETARLMSTSEGDARRVPAAVRDAISRRLERLPDPVVEVLTAAAVLGASTRRERLGGLLGRDVDDDLAEAVAARVIRTDDESLMFEHDLFRETVLAGLPPRDARRWHARVAAALKDTAATNAELAFHCVRSLPDGDADAAVAYSVAAAGDATRALAYEEATGHLRRAQKLAPAAVELELDFADAARRSGDYADARAAYLNAAGRTINPHLVARAALGMHELGTSSEGSHREVVDLLERAAGVVEQPQVLGALARELADGSEHDRDRAAELAARAVAIASGEGDRRALAFCLFAQHDVIWAPGTAARRLELAEAMATAAGDDPDLSFEAAFCRMTALLDLGNPRFEVALKDMARIADQSRLPRQRFYVTSRRAMVAMLRGDDAGALRWIAEADRLGTMIGHPDTMGVRMTQLLVMGLHREGASAARRLEAEYGVIAPVEFEPEMRAMVALADGQPEVAAAILRSSEPGLQRAQFRWRALSALAFDADIAVQAGALDLCRQFYDQLLPYADEVVDIGGATAVVGPAAYYLGMLAQALGRTAPAQRHFAAALETATALGAGPMVERIRAAQPTAVFRRDHDVWTLSFAGATITLPDAKGLRDIATLIAAPGVEISAAELAGLPAAGADPVLDDTARAAYKARLAELDDALDKALDRAGAGAGEADRLEREREALIAELAHAAGLGGRARRLGDPGERARSAVTARIRDTIRRIAERHPALGAHLQQAVTTGRGCSYRPAEPVRWHV
jgi:hypothetical protein